MTTSTIPQQQEAEELHYLAFPLEATEVSAETCAYGAHLVPLDLEGGYDLPQLIAQSATADELPTQWSKWGRVSRASQAEGWLHYATDAKFQSVLRAPEKLIETGARFTTEINVSSFIEDPMPVALSQLFRKRCSTRVFQDAGLKVFIDLHVDGITRALVMEGVPTDHTLFCTKYAKHNLDGEYLGIEAVLEDYDLARSHVDDSLDVLFAVYGAPRSAADEIKSRGWIDIPSIATRLRGGE